MSQGVVKCCQVSQIEKRSSLQAVTSLIGEESISLKSRLSFPATGSPDPGRVPEGFQKGL